MKNILLLICFISTVQLAAQKDTLYFDVSWKKTTKTNASFFRLLPLEKKGDLYRIKDYHINGNLQMEGYWSNIKNETNEGKAKWYSKNGKLTEIRHYTNGKLNEESLVYSKNGFLRAKGTYKDGENWEGTFIDPCCFNGFIPIYKEGERIGQLMFYENSDKIAQKRIQQNDSTSITKYFDNKGNEIGNNLYINGNIKEGMLASFFINDEDDAIGLEGYMHFVNGKMEGEYATFDADGKLFSKVDYQDDKPYLGTSFRYSSLKNYVNGKLEGEEIGYSSKMLPLTKGINKADAHWDGQFIESYEDKIASYKKGKLEGKQVFYFTENLEKIKSYDHILNNKKEGESAIFNKDGKELAKGDYKDDEPWNGTFYDYYDKIVSSYKNGQKHGMFIQYDSSGKILAQQEYEDGQLTGNVKSKGFFKDKNCDCIYKAGNPYSGKVCKNYSVIHYEKGFVVKEENYEYDYDKEELIFTDAFSYNHEGIIKAKTIIKEDKTYSLTFKDGQPYNGVSYTPYKTQIITYKNAIKNGFFSNIAEENRDLRIIGNNKNDLWDGLITFHETQLDKITTCVYKKGRPIKGTVIKNNTFTTYKRGLKQGVEKQIISGGIEEIIERITSYNKGIPLNETWPNEKNQKGTIVKGDYKNGKPFNGDFYEFKPVTASFSHYENGLISGTQYVGYNDRGSLVTIDSMQYKSGKPYKGTFIEHTPDRMHFHEYTKGKLVKTIVTKDDLQNRIRNTVTYSDNGFIVTDRDSDNVMYRLTYLNEEHTKAKVALYSGIDKLAGTLEFYNNKITAIDINYDEAGYKINYALVKDNLVITLKQKGILLKAYPKLERKDKFTYKDFLNPERLFIDGLVVMHTYIEGKKIATGIIKDNDMFDGINIIRNRDNNTYTYFRFNKGKRLDRIEKLTKEGLLKLLSK